MEELSHLLTFWNLALEEPPLERRTGLIAKVRRQGQSYILKIMSEGKDENTASVLQHYDGYGAVRLIQSEGHATLLERAMPGTSLADLLRQGKDEQASHILCDVIQKLHTKETFTGTYPSVGDLQTSFETYLHSRNTQISRDLVVEAQSTYRELVRTQEAPLLLHGDLHHDNVLYDEKRGWLAIDPKGYLGEPLYEVGAMLRNFFGCSELIQNPEAMKTRVSIICERLEFDRTRVIAWAFSQAVLAGIWSVEEGESPEWVLAFCWTFKRSFKAELDFS